jgi:site-specific DNA recombinase
MLRRDLYAGKVIWNSSRFVKVPGTNKRVRRARPESEWRIVPHPELRIIDDELWQRVKERQDKLQATYGVRKGGGILIPRSATSPYLLSGLLKCGSCGANLIIISGYDSSGHHPRYGCSQHFNRGACSNSLTVRRDWIEGRLLDELQNYVLQRDAVEYVLDEFGNQMKNAFASLTNKMAQMRERKQKLEGELRRLAETAAATGPSAFLIEAINEREQQLRELSDQLLTGGANSVDAHLSDIRNFIMGKMGDLRALLAGDPAPARKELLKHVSEIRMMPQVENGKGHYVAKGEWRLLGNEQDTPPALESAHREIRVVAGVGFEPTTFGL